ncbi:MAG: hypothetical protein L6Q73_01810 [Aquabacterium sp.]|nr:hypothetical protein [Aquabacterium sp.]
MSRRITERGFATLTIVLVLLFTAALVAVYNNRQVLAEQRAAAHSARAAQAMAAAEAGIDWVVAQANGDTIDSSCRPDAASPSGFRDRYLRIDDEGRIGFATWPTGTGEGRPDPSCVLTDRGWTCSCPSAAMATLVGAVDDAPSTFRVRLGAAGGAGAGPYPGTVGLTVRACSEPIQGLDPGDFDAPDACHRADGAAARVDAQATVEVTLGLLSALPVAPAAALTIGADVHIAPAATMHVINSDPTTGLTVHSGGAISGALATVGPAGSAGATRTADAELAAAAGAADGLIERYLGLPWAMYSAQPAARRLECRPCSARDVLLAWQRTPGGVLWIDGDLILDDAVTLGTHDRPLMLVVRGNLEIAAPLAVQGAALTTGALRWRAAGASWQGALVAAQMDVTADAVVVRDAAVVRRIRTTVGSFVRVPGSWRSS